MVEREIVSNRVATTVAVAMSAGVATLTPDSYAGFPAAGQGRLRVGDPAVPLSVELVLVTDFATHPWPVVRGAEGSTAVSHPVGQEVATLLTAGALDALVGVYESGGLVANTRELDFAGAAVTVAGTRAVVTVAGGGTPATTVESGTAFGVAPAVGTDTAYAREDHQHGTPTDPVTAHAAAGDPHPGYVLESLVDAKGDVLTATAADAPARLAVGADGQVLVADSAEPTGLKWASAPAGSGDVATDVLWDAAGDLAVGSGADTAVRLPVGATGEHLVVRAGTPAWEARETWVNFVIDGGGSAIATGQKGQFVVPAGTILEARLLADQTGSIVVDLWKDSYANHPPTVADTITAAAKPTISAATKATDTTLTGWTTALAAGDALAVNVDSCATIVRCTVALRIRGA